MVDSMVSIIMPVHNGEKTIGESIESVLAQTYSDWELIIIDDCSTDGTNKIVEQYKDARISYFYLPKNQGVANARNEGISRANGRYIAFLDSDDLWMPEKLEHQMAFMRDNCYGFSYTEYRQFTNRPNDAGKNIRVHDSIDYKELLKGNDIGCLTVMLDRKQFPKINMPNVRHEDYVTWLNLLRNGGNAYGLHADLARYRKSDNSLSGNKLQSIKWTWDVYRRSQQLPLYKALNNMWYYIIKGILKHY